MSKELEALKILRTGGVGYTFDEYSKAVDIVESALKKQVQDQKKLKKYEKARKLISKIVDIVDIKTLKDFKIMLEEVNDMDKSLDIIINKGVDIAEIMVCQDYVQYEARFCANVKGRIKLNKEEYDFLKRTLFL